MALVAGYATQAFAQTESTREPSPQQAKKPSAAAGGSAVAQPDQAASRRLFREFDRNGDGYLAPDELRGERARDGRIAPSEFTAIGN